MAWWHDPLDDDLGPICGRSYIRRNPGLAPVEPWQARKLVDRDALLDFRRGANRQLGCMALYPQFQHRGNSFFDTQFAISQLSIDGRFSGFFIRLGIAPLGTTSGTTSPLYCGLHG